MAASVLNIGFAQHFAVYLLEQTDHATVDAVVRTVGLPHPLEVDADAKISVLEEAAFIEAASLAAKDIDFGFLGGLTLSVGTALPGYISEHSRTIRDAITDAARFLPLVRPGLEFELSQGGNVAAVTCRFTDPDLARYPRHTEAVFAGVVGQIRAFTARPFRPEGLSFRHDRAPVGKKVRSGLGCDVSFGSDQTEMLIPHAVLDRPIRGRNDALRALLVEHGELLEGVADRGEMDFAERVELAVQHAFPETVPDAETVARTLGVSRRTLARRLADCGTAFSEIVAQVRARVAARELRESDRSIAEIAWRLGYSSQSSFSTAFRRVTGLTPKAFRRTGAADEAHPTRFPLEL